MLQISPPGIFESNYFIYRLNMGIAINFNSRKCFEAFRHPTLKNRHCQFPQRNTLPSCLSLQTFRYLHLNVWEQQSTAKHALHSRRLRHHDCIAVVSLGYAKVLPALT